MKKINYILLAVIVVSGLLKIAYGLMGGESCTSSADTCGLYGQLSIVLLGLVLFATLVSNMTIGGKNIPPPVEHILLGSSIVFGFAILILFYVTGVFNAFGMFFF